jgi:AcrR family transcriptional regulator
VRDDRETRERLLRAAAHLFATRGFKKVTVREICHAARANVASVNYHFGSKLGIYREVLQIAIDAMREMTEAARAAGEGEAADERLRRYIVIFLQRLLEPGHEIVHHLIHREINDPTPALDVLVEQGARPRVAYLARIVADMIGREPADQQVMQCVASIQSQFVAYLPNPIASRLGFDFKPTAARIEAAARHIAEFSVAGVRAAGRASSAGISSSGGRARAV